MQSALDEEFGTPLFTAPVGGAVKDKRQEAVAVVGDSGGLTCVEPSLGRM